MQDWLLISALLVAVVVAGCAAVVPHGDPAVLCPEPKAYTADEERRASAELLALPPDSVIAVMITDYGRERAELRACRQGSP